MSCRNSDNDTGTFRNSDIPGFEIQTEDMPQVRGPKVFLYPLQCWSLHERHNDDTTNDWELALEKNNIEYKSKDGTRLANRLSTNQYINSIDFPGIFSRPRLLLPN